ncbi:MAG TPA: DNA methyltransferase [Roseiflexaceae bacterium]|nr:DNA methyltransferase [Roseiflexaceae bacterium]HMP39701.1 DNA methyltransferase [Roseiflexaceae bacterium]
MSERVSRSLQLRDPEYIPAAAVVRLDRGMLVEALGRLRNSSSIDELRHITAQLSHQIDAGELATRDGQAAIELSQRYLHGDLEQIEAAQTLERAHYYVERLIKALLEVRTGALNDINLNRWKEYDDIQTDSLWLVDRRDRSGVHTADYWGNFVPQIPYQMLRRYTRPGEWVLDPFVGSGTTLIEAQRLGRHAIGIDLQESSAEQARRAISAEPNPHGTINAIYTGDSAVLDYAALLTQHQCASVQLAILHPPYYDIIKFSDDPRDLSNAASIERFIEQMGQVVERVTQVLDRGRFLVLVIGDKYARGEWIPLGFQTMHAVQQHGFLLKSIIVKNFDQTAGKRAQKELWRYRALAGGFYVFKHEYIFLLQKQ